MELDRQGAARMLQGAGLALMLAFSFNLLLLALPLQLLQSAWIERVAAGLRNNASLPLVAVVLLVVAALADPESARLARRVRRLRALSLWAAFGFLMLVPLQTYAGIRVLADQQVPGRQAQQQLIRTIEEIEAARGEEALRRAIRRALGAPDDFAIRFEQPLEEVRARVLRDASERRIQLGARLEQQMRERLTNAFREWLFQGLIAVSYAFGFATLADPELMGRLLTRPAR